MGFLVSIVLATVLTLSGAPPIASIAVSGNQALPTDAIIAASGLRLHDDGGTAVFDEARDRLLDTGYFDAVRYSFRQEDGAISVTLTVAELKQMYPVRPDGLPVTRDRVTQILSAGDPLFQGLLPGTDNALARAAGAVEKFLAGNNPGLHVIAKVVNTGGGHFEVLLTPEELPRIADVTFEGSSLIKASELHDLMIENGIGQVYGDANMRELLDRFIRPLYEKQGYVRVSFPQITGKPSAAVKGIDVHVTVVDGPQFRLGDVSVRGNVDDPRLILRMANLSRGAFVNGDELLQAVSRIRDGLRQEGYLDATVSTDRRIDDTTRTVDAWFEVNPGARYRMGRLEVVGLGLDGEAAIRKMWSVKAGEPFPGGYPDGFVQGVKEEGLFDNLDGITAAPTIHKETRTVDVTLTFNGSRTSSQKRHVPY